MSNKKPKVKKALTTESVKAERAKRAQQAQNRKNTSERMTSLAYWKGVKHEMSKVIWPTKKELGAFTVVVLCTCAFFALGFWAIDSGFLAILRAVLGITLN